MTLYGIPNCDTVKKARAWLQAHQHIYEFHDFKKCGVDPVWLQQVCAQLGWQALLNQRGTTWRKLDSATRDRVIDQHSAGALMLAHPSLIKRPILEADGKYHLGFDELQYQAILGG